MAAHLRDNAETRLSAYQKCNFDFALISYLGSYDPYVTA